MVREDPLNMQKTLDTQRIFLNHFLTASRHFKLIPSTNLINFTTHPNHCCVQDVYVFYVEGVMWVRRRDLRKTVEQLLNSLLHAHLTYPTEYATVCTRRVVKLIRVVLGPCSRGQEDVRKGSVTPSYFIDTSNWSLPPTLSTTPPTHPHHFKFCIILNGCGF